MDRKDITFSQAEGIQPLPTQLELKTLSQEFRAQLWLYLHAELERTQKSVDMVGYVIGEPWRQIWKDCHVWLDHQPVDEFDARIKKILPIIKDEVFQSPYNRVFDILQFVLRHPACPSDARKRIRGVFRISRVAYTIVDDGPTIVPSASPEQGAVVEKAFEDLRATPLEGARSHLRLAGENLTKGDLAGSVRESIHAVEAVVRTLDPDHANSFEAALRALEPKVSLHPALKQALSRLYGYSSDEKGIRHPLLDQPIANLDAADAIFMYGACSSFVSYLIAKARSAGVLDR